MLTTWFALTCVIVWLTVLLQEQFETFDYTAYCPKQYLYAKFDNTENSRQATFVRNCFCNRMTILELAFGSQVQY